MWRVIKLQFASYWKITIGSAAFALLLTLVVYAFGLFPKAGPWVRLTPILFVVGAHVLLLVFVLGFELVRVVKAFRVRPRFDIERQSRLFVESDTGNAVTSLTVRITNRSHLSLHVLPEERMAYVPADAPEGAQLQAFLKKAPREQRLEIDYEYENDFDYCGYHFCRIVRAYKLSGDGLRKGESVEYALQLAISRNFEQWLGDKLGSEDFISLEYKDHPSMAGYQIDVPPGYKLNPVRLEVLNPDTDSIDLLETLRFRHINKQLVALSGSPLIWTVINPIPGYRYFCYYRIERR